MVSLKIFSPQPCSLPFHVRHVRAILSCGYPDADSCCHPPFCGSNYDILDRMSFTLM